MTAVAGLSAVQDQLYLRLHGAGAIAQGVGKIVFRHSFERSGLTLAEGQRVASPKSVRGRTFRIRRGCCTACPLGHLGSPCIPDSLFRIVLTFQVCSNGRWTFTGNAQLSSSHSKSSCRNDNRAQISPAAPSEIIQRTSALVKERPNPHSRHTINACQPSRGRSGCLSASR